MPRDAPDESQNDRTQLNLRVGDCEERLDSVERIQREDHDRITVMGVTVAELVRAREKGGDKMWSVILIGIGVIIQAAGAIFTLVRK